MIRPLPSPTPTRLAMWATIPAPIYCATGQFNLENIPIGPGQRLVGGKYTLYISMKDAATASNTETFAIFGNCGGYSQTFNIPITNAWPSTARGVFGAGRPDPARGTGCVLGMRFFGATTADQIQMGYVDFAPVAEQLNAQTINVTTINRPPARPGARPTGAHSRRLPASRADTLAPPREGRPRSPPTRALPTLPFRCARLRGFSPSGCFFVDGEYECYAAIAGSTSPGSRAAPTRRRRRRTTAARGGRRSPGAGQHPADSLDRGRLWSDRGANPGHQ